MVLPINTKRETGRAAQLGNISAAKAVADIIRTTLGPRLAQVPVGVAASAGRCCAFRTPLRRDVLRCGKLSRTHSSSMVLPAMIFHFFIFFVCVRW